MSIFIADRKDWAFTRRALFCVCAIAATFFLSPPLFAQVIVPPPGAPLRAEILNALRPRVMAEIGGAIEFKVNTLRVLQDWAYVSAAPQRPGGGRIDWTKTKFREAWKADMMSDEVLALLKRENGVWHVVECVVGPTDVAWLDWIKPHQVPKLLFTDDPNVQ